MPSRKLSPAQYSLLQRIVDGEIVTSADGAPAVTVYALRNRALLKLEKQGRRWTAKPTDAGRAAALTGWVPPHLPVPKGPASKAAPKREAAAKKSSATKPDVGKKVVEATREGLQGRPDDKGIIHATGENCARVSVGRGSRARAVRLLAQLFKQAERAGLDVAVSRNYDNYGRPDFRVTLGAQGHRVGFHITESTKRTPHEPTKRELAAKVRYEWTRIPKWDYNPGGALTLTLASSAQRTERAHRVTFADAATSTLEDKVVEIVEEVALQCAEDYVWRVEQHRLDVLYDAERDLAIERARVLQFEDSKGEQAFEQVARWRQAQELRAYASAMSPRARTAEERDWVSWMEKRASLIDPPTVCPLPTPPTKQISEYELGDYLRDWPYTRPTSWRPPADDTDIP